MVGCPHHPGGKRNGILSKGALLSHIISTHSAQFHKADMEICEAANIHVCPQCPCAIFTSDKKLAQHHRTHHTDTRTVPNLALCLKHIQGELPPNYNPIWDEGLKFIHDNIEPDPANFCSGVCEKVDAGLREQFDDIVMGVIYADVDAAHVGLDTYAWDSRAHVFLWLLFHVEMLIMGPKLRKSDDKETINQCFARRINLFRCGHIELL